MTHQKKLQKSKDETLKAIKKLSDINPYCLDVILEDTIRLINTIEQIHKLCKEANNAAKQPTPK